MGEYDILKALTVSPVLAPGLIVPSEVLHCKPHDEPADGEWTHREASKMIMRRTVNGAVTDCSQLLGDYRNRSCVQCSLSLRAVSGTSSSFR